MANVSKMEESLRKLKKVRERGGAGAGERGTKEGDRLSDDDKIRLQVRPILLSSADNSFKQTAISYVF